MGDYRDLLIPAKDDSSDSSNNFSCHVLESELKPATTVDSPHSGEVHSNFRPNVQVVAQSENGGPNITDELPPLPHYPSHTSRMHRQPYLEPRKILSFRSGPVLGLQSHLNPGEFYLSRQIHRDEETGKILNLVFVWADEGNELKVDVPVVFKGLEYCPGLKKEYMVHSYNKNGLCAIGFMDSHYPVRSAFSLLNQVVDEYQRNFGESWRTTEADSTQIWPYLDEALTKFQDPTETDKLLKIQRELDETKIILLLQAVMQHDNSSELALAVDIWSLGCTIIEMFTGKAPWSEYEGAAAMFKVMRDTPPTPETLAPQGKNFFWRIN
ncbi:VAMP-like protein YKT62 [Hibiscus syriacus]|uniref:VAMP-like protein YKT62 n=1 Tax=Hibiscus syriacus TaxID=106335 RepID=A0A6A3C317_HIBSY|nr:VAMP-like protein YKT62 [Hibiscus syriacus]